MSRLTLELLDDPELWRIAEQAYAEVRAEVEAENRRGARSLITRARIADRILELSDWRRRAGRAEKALRDLAVPAPTEEPL